MFILTNPFVPWRLSSRPFQLVIAVGAAATFWSPAVCDELRPTKFKVTVLEQVRHEITVSADEERAARTVALLEARRTSGSPNPGWKPSPPMVLAHVHEANDFAVIGIEPLPLLAAPKPHPVSFPRIDRGLAKNVAKTKPNGSHFRLAPLEPGASFK